MCVAEKASPAVVMGAPAWRVRWLALGAAGRGWLLTFVLVSQPVLTTSTYVVAWPQGDQLGEMVGAGPSPVFLATDLWHQSYKEKRPAGRHVERLPPWLRSLALVFILLGLGGYLLA